MTLPILLLDWKIAVAEALCIKWQTLNFNGFEDLVKGLMGL